MHGQMTTSTPASRRRVIFLGDALCESALLQAHATTCGHDFRPVFAPLRDYLAASDYVSPCGFDDEHLNAEGHEILADAVCRVLTESLMRSA